MWYFTWVLGLGLACAFGMLNAMWFELDADKQASKRPADQRNLPVTVSSPRAVIGTKSGCRPPADSRNRWSHHAIR